MATNDAAKRRFVFDAALSTAIAANGVLCVGIKSETCPLEGSWKSVNFLNPVSDGAVLPILHLNDYKISAPTVQARTSDDDLKALYVGRGYKPYFVEGDDPEVVHQLLAAAMASLRGAPFVGPVPFGGAGGFPRRGPRRVRNFMPDGHEAPRMVRRTWECTVSSKVHNGVERSSMAWVTTI